MPTVRLRPYSFFSKKANLVITDVDTYTGGLAYNYGINGVSVTINGGDHYLMYLTLDGNGRGLVTSNANITATVNNARIMMSYVNAAGSLGTRKVPSNTTKLSEMTFNNCVIAMVDGRQASSHTLIYNANEHTYFYFNGCDIYGAFMPFLNSWDTSTDTAYNSSGVAAGAATNANIVFGEGTRWNEAVGNETATNAATVVPSLAAGMTEYTLDTSGTYSFDAYQAQATCPTLDNFAPTSTSKTWAYSKVYGTVATINWGACTCGLDSCDETHPGNAISSLEPGTNIYSAYESAVPNGYDWNVIVDGIYYALAGWRNTETGEELASDAVVTADMLGKSHTYTPIINQGIPLWSYTNTAGSPVTVFESDNKTIAEIFADAQAGSTVTLLDDVEVPDTASVTVSKVLTLDLNGHTLMDVKTPAAKYTTFTYKADFTIKGDEEGSRIIKTHQVNAAGNYQGTFCAPGSSSATLTLTGENLTVFVPCLVASWGTTINVNIDGGYYAMGNSSDNGGWVYANASTILNVDLKNATFYDVHGFSAYTGNTKAVTINADNCTFLGHAVRVFTQGMTGTFTNCYIASSAKFGYNNNVTQIVDEGGVIYFGEGNWISSSAETSLLDYGTNITA